MVKWRGWSRTHQTPMTVTPAYVLHRNSWSNISHRICCGLNVYPKSSCVGNLTPIFVCREYLERGIGRLTGTFWFRKVRPSHSVNGIEAEEDKPGLTHLLHLTMWHHLPCDKNPSPSAKQILVPDSCTCQPQNYIGLINFFLYKLPSLGYFFIAPANGLWHCLKL